MENPEVMIGIPTLNGSERLERCLRSIFKYSNLDLYKAEVVVSDDFSNNREFNLNKAVVNAFRVPMLVTDQRLGVAEQWNRLVRHTPAPIQIIMNDDVEVVKDWLDALVYTVKNNPLAGMIGLKAYQGVTTQNFTPPPALSYEESRMERGRGLISSCGYLFGFLKEKWESVGGFDTRYYAFYEELTFGYECYKRGWPSYMLSYPIILHQGGATTSDPANINAHRVLLESRRTFQEKYGSITSVRNEIIETDEHSSRPKLDQWNTGLSTTRE